MGEPASGLTRFVNDVDGDCIFDSVRIGRLKVSFVGISVPGLDPGRIVKKNQDGFAVFENERADGEASGPPLVFGVFDGHGKFGRKMSQFIACNIGPELYSKGGSKIEQKVVEAFVKTNDALLEKLGKYCKLSGSTGTICCVSEEGLILGNVGDSPAILGTLETSEGGSSVVATRLTVDHNPKHPDESKRIYQNNGLIHPFLDDDNTYVGPLRVWTGDDRGPGLCVTRAFGDLLGSEVGVIPEPSVESFDINPKDKYLLICSDGVTEFISDQELLEKIHGMLTSGKSPVDTCQEILDEAKKRWALEDEDVCDDCTCLLLMLDHEAE